MKAGVLSSPIPGTLNGRPFHEGRMRDLLTKKKVEGTARPHQDLQKTQEKGRLYPRRESGECTGISMDGNVNENA